MKGSNRLGRSIAAAALAATAIGVLAHPALAGPPAPDLPEDSAIAVEAGNKVFLVGHAVGDQIYRCNAVAGGFAWRLRAPSADLYDDRGRIIVTHFGGPSWRATDGSTVVGKREAGVPVDGTIDWLRLSATPTADSPQDGRLTGTTFIQRINTTGGVIPPAGECNAGTVDTEKAVPYTADYYFWKATGG
jgi:Protein of unknown function (DUF3455)